MAGITSNQVARAYTKRVKVGAFYTDGANVLEVKEVWPVGAIKLCDVKTGVLSVWTIIVFRRTFWLVKAAA